MNTKLGTQCHTPASDKIDAPRCHCTTLLISWIVVGIQQRQPTPSPNRTSPHSRFHADTRRRRASLCLTHSLQQVTLVAAMEVSEITTMESRMRLKNQPFGGPRIIVVRGDHVLPHKPWSLCDHKREMDATWH